MLLPQARISSAGSSKNRAKHCRNLCRIKKGKDLFEDTQQNIIFGINDKCVFIEDIVAINWVLVESDEADSYGRKFSCQCKNPADDISITYETGKQRWKNPLVKFNDVYSPMPDKDDIWMNDLALIVTELIEKNASRERFHKICFCYNDLN